MKKIELILLIFILTSCEQDRKAPIAIINNDTIINTASPTKISTDSLSSDAYTLSYYKHDSFAFSDIYGDLSYRKKISDTASNWHNQASIIQQYLLTKFPNHFAVVDSLIVLKLSNGKTKSYPLWDHEKDEGYNFDNYFSSIDYYLLRVQWTEGNCWMLVNRKNGFQKYIGGLPYISPDNKNILTINSDLEAGYSFNGIELYSINDDSLILEFKKETEWGPIEALWISNNNFLLKREFFYVDPVTHNQANKNDYVRVAMNKKTLLTDAK